MLMAASVLLGTDDVKILDLLTAHLTATFIASFQWLLKIGFTPLHTPAMTYSKCRGTNFTKSYCLFLGYLIKLPCIF